MLLEDKQNSRRKLDVSQAFSATWAQKTGFAAGGGGKALKAASEAGRVNGAPGGAEVGAGRLAAWKVAAEGWLRAKDPGRPLSYLDGRVGEGWTADEGG